MSTVVSEAGANFPSALTYARAAAGDFTHPIYLAKNTDPLITISLVNTNAIHGTQIRIPAGALASASGDGHICVVQPDGWEYDFWQAVVSGGVLSATNGCKLRWDGLGYKTTANAAAGEFVGTGATAAYMGLAAGIIRADELVAGVINHALFLVLPQCTASSDVSFGFGTQAGSGGASSYVYPAFAGGAAGSGTRAPLGTRFQLNMTVAAINATSAPAWEKAIARAAATYGMIVGDTGGPGFGLMFENDIAYTSLGKVSPLTTYAISLGLTKDATFGYTFLRSGQINWAANVRVLAPIAH
jgi:hypothetical protein